MRSQGKTAASPPRGPNTESTVPAGKRGCLGFWSPDVHSWLCMWLSPACPPSASKPGIAAQGGLLFVSGQGQPGARVSPGPQEHRAKLDSFHLPRGSRCPQHKPRGYPTWGARGPPSDHCWWQQRPVRYLQRSICPCASTDTTKLGL